MSDVTLSAAVRQSLLSLQNTTNLIERTQNRLSTGLRVASAIDDPVAFFQAKTLSDRSSDFLEKKDSIDQSISTVTGALDGVEAIEALVKQMKGISNSMKSATAAQISDLVSQFNDLRNQINNLAADATYQGTNLINGTGQTLSVEFSEKTASLLNINSVDLRSSTAGLNIAANAYFTGDDSVTHATISFANAAGTNTVAGGRYLSNTADFTVTYQGSQKTFSAGETISFTYGTGATFNFVNSTQGALTLSQGEALSVVVSTSTTAAAVSQVALVGDKTINLSFTYEEKRVAQLSTASGGGGSARSAESGIAANGTYGSAISALSARSAETAAVKDTLAVTYQGNNTITLTTADSVTFTFGTAQQTISIASGSSLVLSAGKAFTFTLVSTASNGSQATGAAYISLAGTVGGARGISASDTLKYGVALNGGATGSVSITANGGEFTFTGLVKAGDTTKINAVIEQLDSALTTLRTQAQTLGSNVALLNTRLDFTEQYTATLQSGSDKLTLADINDEGANLLALQTRQQLGIQSLALAAQAEASILSLFG